MQSHDTRSHALMPTANSAHKKLYFSCISLSRYRACLVGVIMGKTTELKTVTCRLRSQSTFQGQRQMLDLSHMIGTTPQPVMSPGNWNKDLKASNLTSTMCGDLRDSDYLCPVSGVWLLYYSVAERFIHERIKWKKKQRKKQRKEQHQQ